MMSTFRKKPVEVEAWQFTPEACATVPAWVKARWEKGRMVDGAFHGSKDGEDLLFIDTLEGTMSARVNDWIIKGVKGELYPCKPDIFAATYEAVIEPTNEMGAPGDEGDQASPSSADLSRGSDVPSPMTSEQRAEVLETIKFIRERADDRAPCLNLAMARLLNLADAASEMAQSNDHARSVEAVLKKALDYFEPLEGERPVPYTHRGNTVPNVEKEIANEIRAALASPSEPSGRGESGAIQGPASEASMNKEEQK